MLSPEQIPLDSHVSSTAEDASDCEPGAASHAEQNNIEQLADPEPRVMTSESTSHGPKERFSSPPETFEVGLPRLACASKAGMPTAIEAGIASVKAFMMHPRQGHMIMMSPM